MFFSEMKYVEGILDRILFFFLACYGNTLPPRRLGLDSIRTLLELWLPGHNAAPGGAEREKKTTAKQQKARKLCMTPHLHHSGFTCGRKQTSRRLFGMSLVCLEFCPAVPPSCLETERLLAEIKS